MKISKTAYFYLWLDLFCNTIYSGVDILSALILSSIVDNGLQFAARQNIWTAILPRILAFILVKLTMTMLVQGDMYFGYKARAHLHRDFKYRILDTVSGLNRADYEKQEEGWYLSLLNYDTEEAAHYIDAKFTIYRTLLSIMILLVSLFQTVGLLLCLVLVLCVAGVVYLSGRQNKALENKGHELSEKQGQYISFLEHLLSCLGMQDHQSIPYLKKAHACENEKLEKQRLDYNQSLALSQLKNRLSVSSMDIATFYGTLILLLAGGFTVGKAMAAFTFVRSLFFDVSEMTDNLASLSLGKASLNKLDSFIKESNDSFSKPPVTVLEKDIVFKNVYLQLSDQFTLYFDGSFEKGKKYALIGFSGSGKSTLLSLLCQEQQPTSGHIDVDGNDLANRDFSLMVNRNNAQTILLTGSQKDNVTIYDTYPGMFTLDEKTTLSGLSGGQLQALESERLMSAGKPVILLDESFRAMDSQLTADYLNQFLNSDATVFAVSHDLSEAVLSGFDEILMFEKGQCIFRGTYPELSKEEKFIILAKGGDGA